MDKISQGITPSSFQQPRINTAVAVQKTAGEAIEPKDSLAVTGSKGEVREEPLIDEHLKTEYSAITGRIGDVIGSTAGTALAFAAGVLALSNPVGWTLAGMGGLILGGAVGKKIGQHVGMKKAEKIIDGQKELLARMTGEGIKEEEGRKNFRLVKSSVGEGETLGKVAGEFMEIQDKAGKDKPELAREIFTTIRESGTLQEFTKEQVFRCLDSAPDAEKGFENFKSIREGLGEHERLSESIDLFTSVYDKVGKDNDKAKEVFSMLKETKVKALRDEETKELFNMIDSGSGIDKAIDTFKFVKSSVNEGEIFHNAMEFYQDVADSFPNLKESEHRQIFSTVANTESPSNRDNALKQMDRHIKAENGFDDALNNYKLVRNGLQKEESLTGATDDFMKIMNKLGSSNTDGVRAIFNYVRQTPFGEDRDAETIEIFRHIDAENGYQDGLDNYKIIKNNLQPGETVSSAGDDFLAILKKMGDNNTEEVRKTFNALRQTEPGPERASNLEMLKNLIDAAGTNSVNGLSKVYSELLKTPAGSQRQTEAEEMARHLKIENSADDALGNFLLIRNNLQPGETLKSADDDFLAIMKTMGSNNTEDARKLFTLIRHTPAGEQREAEMKEIQKHIKAENGLEDALTNFRIVKDNLMPGETVSSAGNDLIAILNEMGDSNTEEARKTFNLLRQTPPGVERTENMEMLQGLIKASGKSGVNGISKVYSQLLRAPAGEQRKEEAVEIARYLKVENGADDALGNFLLVKNGLQPGETLKSAGDDFLKIFSNYGSSGTEEARKVFSFLRKVPAGSQRETETEELMRHLKAENGVDDALGNIQLVKGNLDNGETLKQGSDDFLQIIGRFGSSGTEDARKIFARLRKFPAGNERTEKRDLMFKLLDRNKNNAHKALMEFEQS